MGMMEGAARLVTSRLFVTWLIYLLPLVVAILLFGVYQVALIDGDSYSYVHWYPWRTAAYPLFLMAVPFEILLPIQLGILVAAITFFARVIISAGDAPLIALAIVVGLIVNTYVWQLQASIMTEVLTTPLLILVFAFSLLFLLRRADSRLLPERCCRASRQPCGRHAFR